MRVGSFFLHTVHTRKRTFCLGIRKFPASGSLPFTGNISTKTNDSATCGDIRKVSNYNTIATYLLRQPRLCLLGLSPYTSSNCVDSAKRTTTDRTKSTYRRRVASSHPYHRTVLGLGAIYCSCGVLIAACRLVSQTTE